MAKVFLSYDREDTERARPVALALEQAGHAVWWDLQIRGGEQFTSHDPRMMAVAKRLGLLDYWQKTENWPDFCFDPDLRYDCKKEAAKLAA
ncbi:MAG TPA: TIR domain-containing protein [Sphingomicrobium sp.]|jgi:hypothetical protein|nr:TIR domain-containing protein [Sphingomicrobium sp.]